MRGVCVLHIAAAHPPVCASCCCCRAVTRTPPLPSPALPVQAGALGAYGGGDALGSLGGDAFLPEDALPRLDGVDDLLDSFLVVKGEDGAIPSLHGLGSGEHGGL